MHVCTHGHQAMLSDTSKTTLEAISFEQISIFKSNPIHWCNVSLLVIKFFRWVEATTS